MSKRDSKLLIEDMLEAISKINSYIGQGDFDEFRKDDKTVDVVVRNLENHRRSSKSYTRFCYKRIKTHRLEKNNWLKE